MKINTITVVGGGTAGCVSALILKKRFPQCNIEIVESENIGIVGVGEGSTEQWDDFISYCDFNHFEVIRECGATFKMGIMFEGWDDNPFLHSIIDIFDSNYKGYYYVYSHLVANQHHPKDLNPRWMWHNKTPLSFYNNLNNTPTRQFHFDTFKLNKWLHQKCIERNIKIRVDDIKNIFLKDDGSIKYLCGTRNNYYSDFYIDCSGFSRLILQKKLGVKWKSYSDYLPLNSAMAFQTKEMEEYNLWTKATAHSAGWGWTIPVQEKTGNGYVYSDDFISQREAHREMEKYVGQKIRDAKHFKFEAGRLEKFWDKNCCAIGLSSNFVEPLEATSIGSSIQQVFALAAMLPSNDYMRYNEIVVGIYDNIVDYIVAHYLTTKEDTPFWKEIKNNLKIPDSLQYNLDMWKHRMPHNSDIDSSWVLFHANNYIPILHGLKWFDVDAIKAEYEMSSFSDQVIDMLQWFDRDYKYLPFVSHKTIIKSFGLL